MISFKDPNVSVISVYRGYVRNPSNGQSCCVERGKARFNKYSSWLDLRNLVIGYFVGDCMDFIVLALMGDQRFISIWFEEEL